MKTHVVYAPIVLFVYNRPYHTKQTVESLQKNELASESELFIYSDAVKDGGSVKKVSEVREYIRSIGGFKKVTVIEREKNWGLANSVIDGVTTIVNKYGNIIVLEDDLVTSVYFLQFMNDALFMYKNEPKVASIHGYIYPINNLPDTFFIKGADCWGWSTWKDKWKIFESDGQKLLDELESKKLEKEADFNGNYNYTKMLKDQINGNNNSWAIRWYISTFLKNMVTLYPGKSYVQNIGHDSEGTHCVDVVDIYKVEIQQKFILGQIKVQENIKCRKQMEQFFYSIKVSLLQRIKSKIVREVLRLKIF
jgi:hypothetical protein